MFIKLYCNIKVLLSTFHSMLTQLLLHLHFQDMKQFLISCKDSGKTVNFFSRYYPKNYPKKQRLNSDKNELSLHFQLGFSLLRPPEKHHCKVNVSDSRIAVEFI